MGMKPEGEVMLKKWGEYIVPSAYSIWKVA
jgi:hypothetical protein